jgi:hypothetical protein
MEDKTSSSDLGLVVSVRELECPTKTQTTAL